MNPDEFLELRNNREFYICLFFFGCKFTMTAEYSLDLYPWCIAAETLVDKAMELDHFGGTFGGNRKATPFMCLTLKMLQIQPEKEIVVEFIKNEDYKWVAISCRAFFLLGFF
jgi:hypothetical protein